MVKNMHKFFYFLAVFALLSCKEDKGNESMPINKVKGLYEPQLNYLNEALADDPDDDELLYKRAKVFLNLYRIPEAMTDIKTAITISPEKPEYYLVLAQVQFSNGNHFESIKATEKAEGLGLTDPELTALQARIYWETGDSSRSGLYLNRINQVAPFHPGIYLLKGKQAAANGDTARAVTFFLSSIRVDRTYIDAYRDLVKIYLSRGKDDSAMFYCIKAKEIHPTHPDFYYTQGRIFYKKEMKQSAITSYQYCLREDSAYAPAMYQLGQLYYREGNPIEAYNYLRKYTTLNNENKEVYRTLITILTEQNKEAATIPFYERLIQLDTSNIALKYKLQKLYNQYATSNVVNPDNNTTVTNPTPVPVVRDTIRRRPVIRRDSTVRNTTRTPVVVDTTK
jgi:tetratricopeptide (TPR) repeat protein